jgi:hypothetical protein
VTQPQRLYWWQWGKILGLATPLLLLIVGIEHSLVWALALHLLTDFAAQTPETSLGKAEGRPRVLAYHAFISGGYPGLVAGGLTGLLISVVVHYLIDQTNKFGLGEPAGPVLDQIAHALTIIMIWMSVAWRGPDAVAT